MGKGTSERLLGRAVKDFRDQVVIATKFGFDLRDAAKIGTAFDSRPEHIRKVTENSLRYLQTDHIDVLQQHRVDPDVPIEEVAGVVKATTCAAGLSSGCPAITRRTSPLTRVLEIVLHGAFGSRYPEQMMPTWS